MVDEVIEKDSEARAAQAESDRIRADRNRISKEIGAMMKEGRKEEALKLKEEVAEGAKRLEELDRIQEEANAIVKKDMMAIPQMISPDVPIGRDDTENVELQRFGEPVVPDFEIPYHTDIMERFDGIDLDSAGRVAGNGFIISAATLRASILPCWPMPAIL
jgi:seryl-tRNA synthetase